MDNLRPVLLIGLAFLGYLIWMEWQKDYAPAPTAPTQSSQTSAQPAAGGAVPDGNTLSAQGNSPGPVEDLPTAANTPVANQALREQEAGDSAPKDSSATMQAPSPVVRVTTDVLEVEIDLVGGTVVRAALLGYPVDLENPADKVELLHREGSNPFIAQSGLLSNQGAPNHTHRYQSSSMSYELGNGSDEISVPLIWQSVDGIQVTNACMHCADPVCMLECPSGAIHRNEEGGQILINDFTCIGCAMCANSCPYDNIQMVTITGDRGLPQYPLKLDGDGNIIAEQTWREPFRKATKCDLCADQPTGPACANACPHDALVRADMRDVDALAAWINRS